MKTRKLISMILLMAMSFSSLHAYAISFLDEEHCSVTEYVQEIQTANLEEFSGDVCDVHHEFHTPFLLPDVITTLTDYQRIPTEISPAESYTFYLQNNVLQPPIFLS